MLFSWINLQKYKADKGVVSDVFNTRQWSYFTDLTNPIFRQDVIRKQESRLLYVDLRWSFGKLEENRRGREGMGGGDFDGSGGGGGDF